MKLTTTITDITKEDLVNLFSTAIYGSNWLGLKIRKTDYYGTSLEDNTDCTEDKWAKVLLDGKSVFVYDYYAEDDDDFYGELFHVYCESRGAMRYTITLSDIKKGIEKAINSGGYDAECAFDLINNDSCDLDLTEAENLLQIIIFGEAIYG